MRLVRNILGSEPRRRANSIAVVATLHNVASAQAQFQATALADEDRDGTGEYGVFGELAGGRPVRGTQTLLNPPVLSRAFATKSASGMVFRQMYHYRIFLPGPDGTPVGEVITTGVLDVDRAEQAWYCVAWPVQMGRLCDWSYLITQDGDIYGKYGIVDPPGAATIDPETGRFAPAGEGWRVLF